MSEAAWLVELESAERLREAIEALRSRGYARLEAHAPYDVPGVVEALDQPRPQYLPRAVLLLALLGASTGYAIQWYSSIAFPDAVVGARPIHAPPAFVPVTFELGVLFGAFAAFVGLLGRRPLLRLWQPVFEVEEFERSTIDRYWLRVDVEDVPARVERLLELLRSLEPLRIERLPR